MGEVYKARDTRLERLVAVKVLSADMSSSPEARQPCEGVQFLVMELLDGETLAARLAKGPLTLDQTLRFGVDIADALDTAHRQGKHARRSKFRSVAGRSHRRALLDCGRGRLLPQHNRGAICDVAERSPRVSVPRGGTSPGLVRSIGPGGGRDWPDRPDEKPPALSRRSVRRLRPPARWRVRPVGSRSGTWRREAADVRCEQRRRRALDAGRPDAVLQRGPGCTAEDLPQEPDDRK